MVQHLNLRMNIVEVHGSSHEKHKITSSLTATKNSWRSSSRWFSQTQKKNEERVVWMHKNCRSDNSQKRTPIKKGNKNPMRERKAYDSCHSCKIETNERGTWMFNWRDTQRNRYHIWTGIIPALVKGYLNDAHHIYRPSRVDHTHMVFWFFFFFVNYWKKQ